MNNRSKILPSVLIFVSAMLIGIWTSHSSWNGITYYYFGDKRQPAAIQKFMDFSHLEGSALQLASKQRVLSEAKLIALEQSLNIQLGNFVTRGENGEKKFACQIYDRIELVFYASGIATSGEKPKVTIQGTCKMGEDVNRIDVAKIPIHKILTEKPANLNLDFFKEDAPISLHFDHVTDGWPREWSLFSVKLYSQTTSVSEVFIDHQQVLETKTELTKMVW